jgi:hypothetical protein
VIAFITEPRVIRKILEHLKNKSNGNRVPPHHATKAST